MSDTTPQKFVDRLNLVPSVLAMSWLWGIPLLLFWAAVFGVVKLSDDQQVVESPSFAGMGVAIAMCFIPLLLGRRFFAMNRPGALRSLYRCLGVRVFRRYTTSGDIILGIVRRKFPDYRVIANENGLQQYLQHSVAGERTHWVMFLFGMLAVGYAIRLEWYGWAALLTLGNLVANFYPCLLQRYNRQRIAVVQERLSRGAR